MKNKKLALMGEITRATRLKLKPSKSGSYAVFRLSQVDISSSPSIICTWRLAA